MDVYETEQERQKLNGEEILRPPLVPSEKNNEGARKPRAREIASRYKESTALPYVSTPKRCPSPIAARTAITPGRSFPKRAQSAERRRPRTPSSPSRPSTPVQESSSGRSMSARTLEGLWPSTRSLSASFQADNFSVPFSKRERPVSHTSHDQTLRSSANVARRQATPERKRTTLRGKHASDQLENSKPVDNSHDGRVVDQHRWVGRMGGKVSANTLTRSVDFTDRISKTASLPIPGRGVSPMRKTPVYDGVSRGIQKTTSDVVRRVTFDGSGRVEYEICPTESCGPASERASSTGRSSRSQLVSLPGSNNPASPNKGSLPSLNRPASPKGSLPSPKGSLPSPKGSLPSLNRPASPRGSLTSLNRPASPSNSLNRPASPSKAPLSSLNRPASPSSKASMSSSAPSRGMLSPSRTRPTTPFPSASSMTGRSSSSSSALSFIADVRKGKKGVNRIEDAHWLRLLYNRYLQWHFVNDRVNLALSIQKEKAEKILYNVWITTSEFHDSVCLKRINLQQLKQEIKINLILREQMTYLDGWALAERDHSSSLSGVIKALEASTLRLPVTGGARADMHTVKDAVSSALDVMQAMASSICSLLSGVEGMNRLVSELADVAARERAMLDECRVLLASTAAMQVEEYSLRINLIQLKQAVHNREQANLNY